MDDCLLNEATGYRSTISNEIASYCLSELDDPEEEYEVSRQIRDTFVAIVNEVCLY